MVTIKISVNTDSEITGQMYSQVLQKLADVVSPEDIKSLHGIKHKLTTAGLKKAINVIKLFSK